jgi:prevent-host-death family protein
MKRSITDKGGEVCDTNQLPIRRGSDNLISMRVMSATDASRSFAALLDQVEAGETIVVTRGRRRIAVIRPASAGNGEEIADLLRSRPFDRQFADDVRSVARHVRDEDVEWPDD